MFIKGDLFSIYVLLLELRNFLGGRFLKNQYILVSRIFFTHIVVPYTIPELEERTESS